MAESVNNRRYHLRDTEDVFYDELSSDEEDEYEQEDYVTDLEEADEDSSFDTDHSDVNEYEEEEIEEELPQPPRKRNRAKSASINSSKITNNDTSNATSNAGRRKSVVYGRGRKDMPAYKWYLQGPDPRGRILTVRTYIPAAKGDAKNVSCPLQAWNLLITEEIINIIVKHTNSQIARVRETLTASGFYKDTNLVEMKALLGILYIIGVQKQNHIHLEEVWHFRFGNILCKAAFAQHRFTFLLSTIRFDDKETRSERRNLHGLAPIKEVWDSFLENCKAYYSPSKFCTIDEQLHSFRGRFKGKIYIPNKPAKYGIKIVSCNDTQTTYMIDAEPYVGKSPGSLDNSARHYLTTLTRTIHNTDRNITCDNWFTQVPVVQELKNDYGLTVVGALRKNKPEIPESFTKNGSPGTTRFGYSNGMTLLSYCPKKNNVVTILSSYHKTSKAVPLGEKPEIVDFYNQTKGGTDEFDKLCKNYTVSRITKRWPLRLFYAILDQAAVNAHILLNLNENVEPLNRRYFLQELGIDLITPLLRERLNNPSIRSSIKRNIREILQEPQESSDNKIKFDNQQRKKCYMCPSESRKRTVYCCSKCQAAACDDHRMHICINCQDN